MPTEKNLDIAKTIELHHQGVSSVEIGNMVGVSQTTVYKRLVKAGIIVPKTAHEPPPPQREPWTYEGREDLLGD